MNDPKDTILADKFGFEHLSEDEQMAMANEAGNLIVKATILRFLSENDEDTCERFSKLLETYADKDNLPGILIEGFPSFGVILDEEAEAFKKDAEAVLNTEARTDEETNEETNN